MRKLFKRIILVIAVLSLVIALSSCSNNLIVSKNTEKIQIRAVTCFTGDDPWVGPWQNAIKKFMKENSNIEIIDESIPTQDDLLRTKVKTDFASGNEPDVTFFFNGVDAKPLLESGKLFNWSKELKNDKTWSKNFTTSAFKEASYKTEIYSLPYIGYYEGLIVNKDLFVKYHVKIPTNYNELLKAISIFNKNKIIPIANSFIDSRYLIEHTILAAGGPKGHATEFDVSWSRGLQIIKELYTKKAFPKNCLMLTDEATQQLFKDKKAAMIINGSWVVSGSKDIKNVIVTNFPLLKATKSHPRDIIAGCGMEWYMSKALNSSKNGAPLKFIKFITSPQVMATFAAKGGVPQIKCNVIGLAPSIKSGWNMEHHANSINSPIDSFLNPDAFNEINKNIPYILTGKKSIEQVLKSAKKLNLK